jgi:amino acid transporter
MFSLGRAGVLPSALRHTNRRGAPGIGSVTTSVITCAVILAFALAGLDPVLNLFYWSAGVAVIAIVVVEILVCAAVVVHFRGPGSGGHWWATLLSPVVAGLGLLGGLYLLISRFGLLAGTVPEGVDPTITPWVLNLLGWSLIVLPFVSLFVGFVHGRMLRRSGRHRQALADVLA